MFLQVRENKPLVILKKKIEGIKYICWVNCKVLGQIITLKSNEFMLKITLNKMY